MTPVHKPYFVWEVWKNEKLNQCRFTSQRNVQDQNSNEYEQIIDFLRYVQKLWKWLLMLGSWPLKDQKHCDRQTVPALNQDVGKSSRWMKSPRCKVKIPRRRKRSNALQESSGLTFSKLDVHSTNWRCPEPICAIPSVLSYHPCFVLKVGLVLEGSKLEGKLGREDFPQNSQSCTFLFPTEIAEEEDGVCGIGPDHAAHKLPAEHYALPLCSRPAVCRAGGAQMQHISFRKCFDKKSFIMAVKRIIV